MDTRQRGQQPPGLAPGQPALAMQMAVPGAYPMAFPMPGHGVGMPPDMMQGMQAMQAMHQMPMAGMMMAPGMVPMPMPRMPGVPLMAPHVTQMLADAAKGGRSSNVFFKTRICNKWRAGNCPYGDKCTYAHGEHELRYVPPELVAQLEAEQKAQEAYQKQEQQQQQQMPRGPELGGGGGPPGMRSYYKTRLCIKYMQTGFCGKGMACTFAHGYEDLRQPDAPLPPHMQQQMAARASMGMGGEAGPRATPVRVPYNLQRSRSPQGAAAEAGGRGFPRDSAAVERARAMSAIAGVGAAEQHADPAVVQSVVAAARSGSAFQETPYSDAVGDHLAGQAHAPQRQQQQQQTPQSTHPAEG